jgi:hypothetical protein
LSRTVRPRPKLLFTEEEQAIYDNYIKSYKDDYPGLSTSDLIQLEDSAVYHILHLRLTGNDIANNGQTWNTRYHPKQLERGILEDLGLRRKDRVQTKQTGNESSSEAEFRDILLSLGRPVRRS